MTVKMTSAQVVETSVTNIDNSPYQVYTNLDDLSIGSIDIDSQLIITGCDVLPHGHIDKAI